MMMETAITPMIHPMYHGLALASIGAFTSAMKIITGVITTIGVTIITTTHTMAMGTTTVDTRVVDIAVAVTDVR
jgi:hypothetical protein